MVERLIEMGLDIPEGGREGAGTGGRVEELVVVGLMRVGEEEEPLIGVWGLSFELGLMSCFEAFE